MGGLSTVRKRRLPLDPSLHHFVANPLYFQAVTPADLVTLAAGEDPVFQAFGVPAIPESGWLEPAATAENG